MDRLLCNLWALDAENSARELGFESPPSEDDTIDDALAALSRLQQLAEPVAEPEEEVLVHEWDEELAEELEYFGDF